MAGAMAAMGDEDLMAYFRVEFRRNLPLLQNPGLAEEALSPFVCLQEKKKQAQQMQKALEAKEQAFRERMGVISCRWRDLHSKEAQLKSHMERYGKTLKENDELRRQALKKAIEERDKRIQKDRELLRAKIELEDLRNKHQKLFNKVQKYSIFKKYLEDVVKISQFEDIQGVTSRYRTLMRVCKDLLQAEQEHKKMSKQARLLLVQYTAEKEAEILQHRNELVQLQLRLEQAQSDTLHWQTRWDDMQHTSSERAQELGAIATAILSLFQAASTQLRVSLNVPVEDSHRQLDMIEQLIQDLTDISVAVRRQSVHSRL